MNARLPGLLALICCCAQASAQAGRCPTIERAATIERIGAFSNTRYRDEHAYGYSVMLWRAGDCVFGLFESAQGLAEDTPIGELRDVTFDRLSGLLTFSAKLTTGLTTTRGSNALVPAHDLFSFSGTLQADTLRGEISHALANEPGVAVARTTVVLPASSTAAELMLDAASYADWVTAWEPILKRRGPKW